MSKTKIAINGFGRIGRSALKIALEKKRLDIVAINDLAKPQTLAHLLKYDTAYGIYNRQVSAGEDYIQVDKKKISVFGERDPGLLPWKDLKVDVVLECTGAFVKDRMAEVHLASGAKKVILSAPPKGSGEVPIYLFGVNHEKYQQEVLVSNASCTTNCLGPVAAVILENCGIKKAIMTTIHSYTQDQNLQDGPHKDLRRARAAAANIVPTTTGAARATAAALPDLRDKFDGIAVRVPTITASLTDFTFLVNRQVTTEEINDIFRKAAKLKRYLGILVVTEDPIVSSDVIGNPASAIVDLGFTRVVAGDLVKILAWYDNEWGYANRLVEMAEFVS